MKWLIVFFSSTLFQCVWANVTFIILHNNDMHSRFDEFDKSIGKKMIGGMARTAYKVNEFRQAANAKKGPPVLFLNAGDTFSGTVWFSIHRWKIVSDFMNLLKPDAMTLGNHEFDDGLTNLTFFVKSTSIPVLCCNCNTTKEPRLQGLFKNSTVLRVRGVRVGVIGYIGSQTSELSWCGNATIINAIEAVRSEARKLSKQGINIIIALGHAGFEMDQRVAREVRDIDVVIGGDSHSFLWNGDPPDLEKPVGVYPKIIYSYEGIRVPVVQVFAHTKYLGYLKVTFNSKGILQDWTGNPIFMNGSIPKDKGVANLVEKYRKQITDIRNIVIGSTVVRLDNLNCRYEECNFGNLVADAFVHYKTDKYTGPYWTDCAIGLVNAGSIKNSIYPGKVTMGDILEAIPFFQELISFDISGKDLVDILETGVEAQKISEVKDEFLQVSGLKIIIDRRKAPRSRIVNVLVRCSNCLQPKFFSLENELYYRVVTNQFVASEGDGRSYFKRHAHHIQYESIKDFQAVIQYFKKVGIINQMTENRILFVGMKTAVIMGNYPKNLTVNDTIWGMSKNRGILHRRSVLINCILCLNIFVLNWYGYVIYL